jgi:DNA-binding MarR family transcriptional regulator
MTRKHVKPVPSSAMPAESPCNLYHLRRAARAVSRQYSAVMKASGLQGPQFSVLSILNSSGAMCISELAIRMGLDRTSMSRNLLPLQNSGLIVIGDEGWHRTREISLTSAGRKALRKAMPLWQQAQAEFIDHLGPEDSATLIALLRRASSIEPSEAD